MSGRLVAAIRITLVSVSKPSISTRIWFSVCSRSSWLPPSPAPRCRPTASISSMKMMHGELRLACSNRSRTRLAPTPTNISTNSEPEIGEERHARLARDRLGHQRLAGAGRADQQHALGDARAQRGELLRLLEELDDLLQFLLGLLRPRHIRKGHRRLVAREHPRPALAEGEGLVAGALRLAQDEDEEAGQQDNTGSTEARIGAMLDQALGGLTSIWI